MKRKIAVCIAAALMSAALAGCASLDVVQTDAARAFGDVLAVFPAESHGNSQWSLTAPDGGAVFNWSSDLISMTIDTKAFTAAGLDYTKLDGTIYYFAGVELFNLRNGSFDMLNRNKEDTPLAQFAADLKFNRRYLGYHSALDHYNIDLGGGNMFEWAKDMASNDKDVVFVLNPEPLIAAGVDPEKVEGWIYTKVPTDDGEVYKLLKPFDLK